MADENKPSRVRAFLQNAVIWGTTWGILGTTWAAIRRLNDNIAFPNAILDGIGMGIRIGFVGGIVGAAFAAFISSKYRGQRLSEINWVRFGLGGLVLAGVLVPGALQGLHYLTDGTLMPFNLITDDMVFSALFGGITAAGTMKLAQMHEKKNPVTVQELLERMETQSLDAGDAANIAAAQRARATEVR